MIPRVLVVGASDPDGDLGVEVAVRTVAALGGHATLAITASPPPAARPSPAAVVAQIDAALADGGADAIVVGFQGSTAIAEAVAERLGRADARVPLVLNGRRAALGDDGATGEDAAAMLDRLLHRATVIALDAAGLAALGNDAAATLARRTGAAVLVSGAEGAGADTLVPPHGPPRSWRHAAIGTPHDASGWMLASAIAVALGAGRPLAVAVEQARTFAHGAAGL